MYPAFRQRAQSESAFPVIFLEGVYVDRTAQGLDAFVQGDHQMPTLRRWSRRSAGVSSTHCGSSGTWKRASTPLWRQL